MRLITKNAIAAFKNRENKVFTNTSVTTENGITSLFLHGNRIATLNEKNELSISNAGWFSNTTKERLNGFDGVSISQKKGIWYLNNVNWDGKWVTIK